MNPEIVTLSTVTNLFGEEVADSADLDLDALAVALHVLLKDITLEEFASYLTNRFEAVIDYAHLCAGEKTGLRISLLFNPHRLDTGTKRFPRSLYAALKDERFAKGLVRAMLVKRKGTSTQSLLQNAINMGVEGTSHVQDFPPYVARDLARDHNVTKHSKVLDPCAGWGGRMLGFSAITNDYTCCEPSSRTAAGLRRLLSFIQAFRPDFAATIHEAPFEDVTLNEALYDFALTSPPYFDTEYYAPGEQTNSANRYPNFKLWSEQFFEPLIHHTMRALKTDACFVLNIGNRLYPLEDCMTTICRNNYSAERLKSYLPTAGLGKTGDEGEGFFVLRKLAHVSVPTVKNLTSDALSFAFRGGAEEQDEATTLTQDVTSFLAATLTPSATSSAQSDLGASVSSSAMDFVSARASEADCAHELLEQLTVRGFTIRQQDGKLQIESAASLSLTDEERTALRTYKPALLQIVPINPVVEAPLQPLSIFLGTAPLHTRSDWVAQEPPSLDGIDDIILNFETNGLNWAGGDEPVGVTIGTLDGKLQRYLPFAHRGGGNLPREQVIRYLQREVRGKRITNTNTRFDVHMGRNIDVDFEAQGCTVSDIQHYAALLDDHRKKFGLDVLANDYLGGVEIGRVDETMMADYAACDVAARAEYQAVLVAKLRDVMWPMLDEQDLQRVRQQEDDVIYPVCEMEKNGAKVDLDLVQQYHDICQRKHDDLMLEISQEVGFAFEHTASGWPRLLAHCHFNVPSSFSEDKLVQYDHPLVKKGILASQYASLDSKTFAAYLKLADTNGIIRYDIHQLRGDEGGTVSGRFSIGYVQQVPNKDNHSAVFGDELFPREVFVAENGNDVLESDARQIEYRLFAHFANNPRVIQAYRDNPLLSYHKMTWEEMKRYKTDMLYTHQKSYNFAKMYGARIIKLGVMLGFFSNEVGEEIRRAKAWDDPRLTLIKEIDNAFNQFMPEANALLDLASHLAKPDCDDYCDKSDKLHRSVHKHRGFVKTILGRRSRFPSGYKTYIGLNRIIQGSGADIMKRKLVELHRERKYTGLLMRLTVHDAVVGDAQQQETRTRIQDVLDAQSFPELRVPILWETGTGKNWAACKG